MKSFPRLLATTLALLVASSAVAGAETQRLRLKAGWNLISFAVEPANPSPSAIVSPLGIKFQALWAYDAASKVWSRFPQPTPGAPTITAVATGKGYWLRVTTAADLDVTGLAGSLPAGPDLVAAGWNLVGFPLLRNAAYDRVLANPAIREVWRFKDGTGPFQGAVIDGTGVVVREDFIELEPGRGYWVLANEATSLAPVLSTTLPADVDLPPLFDESPPVFDQLAWTNISPGDVDVGRDGLYDRSLTQRAIDFEDRVLQHQLVVANGGYGVLRYHLAIDDPENCSWLRFDVRDEVDGTSEKATEIEGAIATERDFLTLAALRAELPEGEYSCSFTMSSNGGAATSGPFADAGPQTTEPVRTYEAFMTVGGLEGDYRLRVEIATVDGKPADLANPRITLSLFEDSEGLKAIVDPDRTLLISSDLHFAGRLIEGGTTRFELDGSQLMAADAPGNPFAVAVRRDITFRGTRSDRAGLGGPAILSPDLAGEYFETIRNLRGDPIRLVGTFTGERLGATASGRDRQQVTNSTGQGIPDNGIRQRTIVITERLLIDEVDVTTNLAHARPSDLIVTLIGPPPESRTVVLRDKSAAGLGTQVFDDLHDSLESLDLYAGMLAPGTWTLRVADVVPGVAGQILSWGLDIRGTRVRDVSGSVCPAVPVGATVILSGCGRTEIAAVAANRTFLFKNLIDCVYQARLEASNFQVAIEELGLAGADVNLGTLCPAAGPVLVPDPVVLPQSAEGTFVAMSVGCGAGLLAPSPAQQYGADAATWDLDRAPIAPSSPGPEDANAFLDVPDGLTGTNAVGGNGFLDGPVGSSGARIFIQMGQPVIGRSVQGNMVLEVGGQP